MRVLIKSRSKLPLFPLQSLHFQNRTFPLQTLHFLYHEIRLAKSDYTYALDLREFEAQAEFMAMSHQLANEQADPIPSFVQPGITFDDGHVSNYEFALPVLSRLGLRAHFFITAGWTGQRTGYMDWPELRSLQRAGQHIGAHGWSHKLLTHCNLAELQHELGDARRKLEDGLGAAVTDISLPGGRSNRRVLAACREAGYERIFTSEPRVEPQPRVDWRIGRVNLLGSSTVGLLRDLLVPGSSKLAALRRTYCLKRALNSCLGDTLYAKVWALSNAGQSADPQAEVEA